MGQTDLPRKPLPKGTLRAATSQSLSKRKRVVLLPNLAISMPHNREPAAFAICHKCVLHHGCCAFSTKHKYMIAQMIGHSPKRGGNEPRYIVPCMACGRVWPVSRMSRLVNTNLPHLPAVCLCECWMARNNYLPHRNTGCEFVFGSKKSGWQWQLGGL